MERERLKEARYHKGWSQEQLAEYIGVTRNTVSRWEQGLSRPYPIHKQKICTLFQMQAATLDLEEPQISIDQLLSSFDETTALVDSTLILVRKQNLAGCFIKIVTSWPRRDSAYHELQTLIRQATEEYTNMNILPDYPVTRRNALHFLALLPIEIFGLSSLKATLKSSPEEMLTHCAAGITACEYLSNGNDLSTAFLIVSAYLPTLVVLAKGYGGPVCQVQKSVVGKIPLSPFQ